MSSQLVQVLISLAQTALANTPTGAAYAGTSVVVTDSTGVAQPAVVLTGKETPPFSFTTSVAPGDGAVVATAVDVNGSALETPVSQSFTEAGSPQQFPPTSGITVTPVSAASASARRK